MNSEPLTKYIIMVYVQLVVYQCDDYSLGVYLKKNKKKLNVVSVYFSDKTCPECMAQWH